MICTLMHKRMDVAELEMDDATGFIHKVNAIYAPEHLPVGVLQTNGIIDRTALNEWWTDRSIPASRSGIREALETLDIASTKLLLLRCYGLSLSDHYWIRPNDSGLSWDQINFFDHAFSDDMGDVLFGKPKKEAEFDFSSPDNTSDGFLKKRWKIINGKRCLIKGGSNPFQQQPFNEVIASGIMERLDIPHVPYSLIWSDGYPYSVCEDFVTPNTELVSAWRVMKTQKKSRSDSVYQHFVKCCRSLGVEDVVPTLDRMLVLDYIIANEDRHLNNFGLLRDPETLKWLGMAPVFDSGSAMGYDRNISRIYADHNTICKPFKKHHEEQLKLVSSFAWINFGALSDVSDLIRETLSNEQAVDFIGADRTDAIVQTVEKRIRTLQKMALTQRPADVSQSIEDDVEQNIAEDYASH